MGNTSPMRTVPGGTVKPPTSGLPGGCVAWDSVGTTPPTKVVAVGAVVLAGSVAALGFESSPQPTKASKVKRELQPTQRRIGTNHPRPESWRDRARAKYGA